MRKLTGDKNYNSIRGITEDKVKTEGKIINHPDNSCSIVFSASNLFSKPFLVRLFSYVHELNHVILRSLIPKSEKRNFTDIQYFEKLSEIFDEYFADRLAPLYAQTSQQSALPPTRLHSLLKKL